MAAIITDTFKKNLIQYLKEDIELASENYYIGIGRSQDWDSADTVVTPINSLYEEAKFRQNLQAIKIAEDISFVVPRNNWTSGTIYSAYNENQAGYPTEKHYVITDDNQVYICLEQGKSIVGTTVTSTVKPTSVDTAPFKLADGYVWKFLYTMSASEANKFLTANYFPVKLQGPTDGGSTAIEIEQENIQNAAVDGQIANLTILNGGSGYTSAPTVSIIGNGSGATAFATVNGGSVVKIEMKDSAAGVLYTPGSGYDYASITFTGGGGAGASARPNIGRKGGFGADARNDLKATGIMFNTKPAGAENDDFIIDQDFRQVGLMRRLRDGGDTADYISATGSALTYMTLSVVNTVFTKDKTIQGTISGAKAFIDKVDGNDIYYHQTIETGFTPFQAAEGVTETAGAGSGTIGTPLQNGDINKFKGEVLYIDNRAAVQRSSSQTEDLKIIIQL